jgi:hypothetical protein
MSRTLIASTLATGLLLAVWIDVARGAPCVTACRTIAACVSTECAGLRSDRGGSVTSARSRWCTTASPT